MYGRLGTKALVLFFLLLNYILTLWLCLHSQGSQLLESNQEASPKPRNGLRMLTVHHADHELAGLDSEKCVIKDDNQTASSSLLRVLHSSLRTIVPSHGTFLPQYHNPCWLMDSKLSSMAKLLYKANITDPSVVSQITNSLFQTDTQTLVCVPSVYFIGFPRSGSTQLYRMMLRHPLLQGGYIKEPHWWTKTKFNEKFPYNLLSVVQYLLHYVESSQQLLNQPETLLVDGSQSTVWDTRTTRNLCAMPLLINSITPKAKYIVLMREPVQRLFSDMLYLCEEVWGVHKNKSLPKPYLTNATEVFLYNARLEITEFEKCLLKESVSVCTHHALSGHHGDLAFKCGRVRLGISLYHVHIKRWLDVIPRDRFLFLRTEEMAEDPITVLQRVWSFLELPDQKHEDLDDILHEHMHGTQRQAINTQSKDFGFINKFFQTYNGQLIELLQDQSFGW